MKESDEENFSGNGAAWSPTDALEIASAASLVESATLALQVSEFVVTEQAEQLLTTSEDFSSTVIQNVSNEAIELSEFRRRSSKDGCVVGDSPNMKQKVTASVTMETVTTSNSATKWTEHIPIGPKPASIAVDSRDARIVLPKRDEVQDMKARNGDSPSNSEGFDETLPQEFTVKFLGKLEAGGLWGIRYTRQPVDRLVAAARELKAGQSLPFVILRVSEQGVEVSAMPHNQNIQYEGGIYPIHLVSYGVQDLVYTRVFAMITVKESCSVGKDSNVALLRPTSGFQEHPFECHAFVCDSRLTARRLTFSLATAFKIFAESPKGQAMKRKPTKFAIDLRLPEELQAEIEIPPVDYSEA